MSPQLVARVSEPGVGPFVGAADHDSDDGVLVGTGAQATAGVTGDSDGAGLDDGANDEAAGSGSGDADGLGAADGVASAPASIAGSGVVSRGTTIKAMTARTTTPMATIPAIR